MVASANGARFRVTSLGPYNLPVPSVTPLRRALACFDVGPAADLTTLGTAVVSFPGCFHCFVVDQYFVVDQAVVGDCTGATDYPTGFATTFQHDRTGVDTLEATTATETTTAIKATATSATASAPATASTTATSIGGSLALGKIVEPWTALSRAAMREGVVMVVLLQIFIVSDIGLIIIFAFSARRTQLQVFDNPPIARNRTLTSTSSGTSTKPWRKEPLAGA
ncbi:hypothetical protein KUF71_000956 [Frankliniella fusca]|uniref:Uncharacterized protein n=1 Tax=Frankliniella fusca TaxID=407009 RepID=A0AAE1HC19_9NEOP|nr:hypothetical protein KUF71_000956 [Frankliniella fusca]